MKKSRILLTPLLEPKKGRRAARSGKIFPRFVLVVIVVAIGVFLSSQTSSAHIGSLIPNQWTAGGPAFTLRILGTDFDESDTGHLFFNGARIAARLISSEELQATIPANLVASPGMAVVQLEDFNAVSFMINPPPTIITDSPLPIGVVGLPYSQTLASAGGSAPLTWSVSTLPQGLNLDASTGVLSGTPEADGTFASITVRVTDAVGVMASKIFSLTIGPVGSCLYTISPKTEIIPSTGGTGLISITAPPNCTWSAEVDTVSKYFISLTSAASGSGNGTLSYSVSPIANGSRSGSIEIRRGPSIIDPIEGVVTVKQEGSVCPTSAYSISPAGAAYESGDGTGSFEVTAPDDCKWTASTNAPWITIDSLSLEPEMGNGEVLYSVSKNNGFWRGASISVAGQAFAVYQDSESCPIKFFCLIFPAVCGVHANDALTVSRRFRDDVLSRSPRGRHYTRLYYEFSSEAVQMMMLHPMLILRSREMFARYMPVVEAMVKGEQPTLSEGDLTEIDDFLNALAADGSPLLHDAVKTLREDLRDPSVQAEFGITVTAGPRRESPAQSRLPQLKQVGPLLPPLGLFIVFAVRRRLHRSLVATRPATRPAASLFKRPFGLAMALLLVGSGSAISGQSSATSPTPPFGQDQSTPTTTVAGKRAANHKAFESESRESHKPQPLAINPALNFSTYFGGGGTDEGNSIAVDGGGNIYVTGFTDSLNFPVAAAAQPGFGGGQQDAFVVKLNPTGTRVIYATYLGGGGQDNGTAIAVDGDGNAYVTGYTDSSDFPVRNALQPTRAGAFNAYVVKLNPTGSIVYSTLLGGSLGDYGSSIAVDKAGSVYVAGIATSPDFPLRNAAQSAFGGLADVFVTKLNAAGTRLVYSTYLGGAGTDAATSIAVDAAGSVYLTGLTTSPNFPTANAPQATHGGGLFDAFVTKLNAAGAQVVYSTYLGGSGVDRAFRIAVNGAGNAYVTGDTDSTDFPAIGAAQAVTGGSADVFVSKLNATGTALDYSTYLGGSEIDGGTGIAVDTAGNATVTGFTASVNFPLASAAQPFFSGGYDGFVARLNATGATLEYAAYLGGSGMDSAFAVAIDATGKAYVMGVTGSLDFPISLPLQMEFGGGISDIFVAKLKSPDPAITGAEISGKNLLVSGSGFDKNAKILIDGQEQKTKNDKTNPSGTLIGKKAGKKIAPGQSVTLQVRNPDGSLSNQIPFTRPVG